MSRNYWTDQKTIDSFVQKDLRTIKEQVAAFNAKCDQLYGYHFPISGNYIRFCASDYSEQGDFATAVELYKWAMELSPDERRIHFGIAYAYEELGELKNALNAYQKALEVVNLQKEEVSEKYYSDVTKWFNEKIRELNE